MIRDKITKFPMKEWYISFVVIQEELEMYRAMRAEARSLEEKLVKNIKQDKKKLNM